MKEKYPWQEKVSRREAFLIIAGIITFVLTYVLLHKIGFIGFVLRLPFGDIFLMVTGALLWIIIPLVFDKLIKKK